MENIALVNGLVFLVVCGICLFFGLDLKKWSSWLIGLYGFLSGYWVGFSSWGSELGLQMGVLLAVIVMSGGAMTRQHRQRYSREAAENWLTRYGQEKQFSLLSRLMRKILKK